MAQDEFRYTGQKLRLDEVATTPPEELDDRGTKARTEALTAKLVDLQDRFYADGRHKLLVVIQATDTGGKDGTIRRVLGPMNPHGVRVVAFKTPTSKELAHDYLWRVHHELPALGELVVFNRSHYEDVLIVRVHDLVPAERWKRRYDHIVNFERMLVDEGTTIVKFFLHISKEEQRERLQARLDDPTKRWKFSEGDLTERRSWDAYQAAYEDMVGRTATPGAPWHVIPADSKWYRDFLVASALVETLESLDLAYPVGPANPESIVID
ncbi:MAG: polyphosphate kinase 2 family protein [Actinobacteria bacterium]|nr:polyphosphate kinase 2 family protein [Actinomycetota bacterium]